MGRVARKRRVGWCRSPFRNEVNIVTFVYADAAAVDFELELNAGRPT